VRSAATAFVGAILILVGACGTQVPEVPNEEAVSYSVHLESLVIAHCLGCHDSEEAKAKLVLDPGLGYDKLVGPRSIQEPEMALVEPGDPERSYLWLKLQRSGALLPVAEAATRYRRGQGHAPDLDWLEEAARIGARALSPLDRRWCETVTGFEFGIRNSEFGITTCPPRIRWQVLPEGMGWKFEIRNPKSEIRICVHLPRHDQ